MEKGKKNQVLRRINEINRTIVTYVWQVNEDEIAMDTTQQAAESRSVSLRHVQRLLAAGRVPAVKKYDRSWMIPSNAKKPSAPRKERLPKNSAILSCFSFMWDGLLPGQAVDTVLQTTENAALPMFCPQPE